MLRNRSSGSNPPAPWPKPAITHQAPPCATHAGGHAEPGIAIVDGAEYPVPLPVAAELNRLRGACLGSLNLIHISEGIRNEAIDLLAEILGPEDGPMTLPSAAALEAWAHRARYLLAWRKGQRAGEPKGRG